MKTITLRTPVPGILSVTGILRQLTLSLQFDGFDECSDIWVSPILDGKAATSEVNEWRL